MKLDQAAIVLRPRGLFASADLGFRFLFAVRPKLWLGLSMLMFGPALLICGVLRRSFDLHWGWLWLIAIAYGSVAQGVFSAAAGLLMFERGVPMRTIVWQFLRRLPAYASLIAFSRLFSLILLPVSGLGAFLWVRWAFVHEAVLLEQAPLSRALHRASDFVRGHLEDALLLLLVLLGLNSLLPLTFEAVGHGLEELLMLPIRDESAFEEGGSLYALLGYFASLPFCGVIRFLSYVDGRTRRDGWDIQVRFMALAAEANDSPSSHATRGGAPS